MRLLGHVECRFAVEEARYVHVVAISAVLAVVDSGIWVSLEVSLGVPGIYLHYDGCFERHLEDCADELQLQQ